MLAAPVVIQIRTPAPPSAFRDKIAPVLELDVTADELVSALLNLARSETVCLLDSCGVGYLGSHLLIAGIDPVETLEVTNSDADETLSFLDEKLSGDLASIFTLSYNLGQKLLGIHSRTKPSETTPEPDVFIARFDVLVVHDYDTGSSFLVGNAANFDRIADKIQANISNFKFETSNSEPLIASNFTKAAYLAAVEQIKEQIRIGNTYQTNLTQQLTAVLPESSTPATIFARLRRDNPTPFSAFIKRLDSTVVSSSPERFFRVEPSKGGNPTGREGVISRTISTSPIKGTRARGKNPDEDTALKNELISSAKDRAENTMIVDLLRNDLGRVCEYGSVRVEKLCDLEEHPTLFHLVSTVTGDLHKDAKFSDILKAVFPCGSITGAPKISTMRIIDEIEPSDRGLSMGAIGISIPISNFKFQISNDGSESSSLEAFLDLSVAIRTMVIRDNVATFNVGGGIVIDSDPESEYQETLTKAKAILSAIGCSSESLLYQKYSPEDI